MNKNSLPSAPAQWALNVANEIYFDDSRNESALAKARLVAARKIESASPVAELTAANAQLLDALRPFAQFDRSKFVGTVWEHAHESAAVLYHQGTGTAVNICDFLRAAKLMAKHSPAKK